jgi:hypothetical protein
MQLIYFILVEHSPAGEEDAIRFIFPCLSNGATCLCYLPVVTALNSPAFIGQGRQGTGIIFFAERSSF